MTATPSRASSHPLQPRPKAAATATTSLQPVTASQTPTSDPSTPILRPNITQHPSYYLSDRATTFLIRRTLCPHNADKNTPISDLLPPLTSSNDVDLQLYAFIAIIIKEFVYTWYSKITPDQTFVEEVVKIIAHCTRGLEQRLRKVDLEALIFDELPELLNTHVRAYRIAYNPIHHDPLESDPRLIYHSLWPSPALSPVPAKNDPASVLIQKENEAAYRQLLVEGVLAILLPTEDFENDCLTSLVGQIISEMILGNGIGEKACEPWLLWEGITKIAEAIQAKLPGSKAQQRVNKSMESTGRDDPSSAGVVRKLKSRWSFEKAFWMIIQYGFFAFTTVRFVIVAIGTSSSLPSRLPLNKKMPGTGPVVDGLQPPSSIMTKSSANKSGPIKIPMMAMKIWTCAANLLDLELRMPWLKATLSMLQWFALQGPGELGYTDGMIDRFLSHAAHTHVLDPALLPPLLRTARSALFPQNAPAPARVAPQPCSSSSAFASASASLNEQQLVIRRRCAETILELIPASLQELYFGPGLDRRLDEVEDVLGVLGDPYCNRHLLYGVVELLVVRLMPELSEKGVIELSEERLN